MKKSICTELWFVGLKVGQELPCPSCTHAPKATQGCSLFLPWASVSCRTGTCADGSHRSLSLGCGEHSDGKLLKEKFCQCVAYRRCSWAAQDLHSSQHPNGNIGSPQGDPTSSEITSVARGSLCSSREQSTTNRIGNKICLLKSPGIREGTQGKATKPGPFVYHLQAELFMCMTNIGSCLEHVNMLTTFMSQL